jgi:hypothetical protein
MLGRAVAVWAGLLLVAVLNGGLRSTLLVPRFGEHTGHVVSTVILSAAILVLTWVAISWIGPHGTGDALRIGATWLVLTLAFEFLAGHYLFHTPWQTLMADYNVIRGRIWVVVLLTTLVAPLLAARLRDLPGFVP